MFAAPLIVLPYLIEISIEKVLIEQGATKAEVEDVDFNLFSGRFSVTKLYAEVPNEEPVELGYFSFDFDWLSLFKKRAVIDELEIHDVVIEVIFEPNQFLSVGGFKIPLTQTENLPEEEQPDTEPSSWNFGVKSLSLVKSKLRVMAPKVDKSIAFKRVTISNFQNWHPDDPSRLSFDIDVAEGTFVGNFDLKLFAESQVADGTLIFDDLFLQSYSTLIDEQLKLAQAKVDGRLSLVVKNTFGEIEATNHGFIEIVDLAIERQQILGKAQRFYWEGQVDANYKPEQLEVHSNSAISLNQAQVNIDQLDVDLDKLRINGDYGFTQQDQQMTIRSAQKILLGLLTLKQADLDLKLDEIIWQGASTSNIDDQQFKAKTQGRFETNQLQLAQNDIRLNLQNTDWDGRIEIDQVGDVLQAITDGRLQLNQFALQQQQNSVSLVKADWQGQVDVKQQSEQLSVDKNSNLVLSQLALSQPQTRLNINQSTLKSHLLLNQTSAGLKLDTEDEKTTRGIEVMADDITVKAKQLTWKGQTHLEQANNQAKTQPLKVDVDGESQLSAVGLYQQDIKLGVNGAYWKGSVKARPGSQQQVTVKGFSRLDQVALSNPKQQVKVAGFKGLKTNISFATPQNVGLSKFRIDQLELAKRNQDKRALAKLKQVSVSHFKMADTENFDIGKILLTGLDVAMVFDEKRRIHQLEAVEKAFETGESNDKPVEKPVENTAQPLKSKPNFRLSAFDMAGDNKIAVLTYATDPQMDKKIQIVKAHIGEMDTKKPKQYTPVDVQIKVDKYTKASIKGKGQPFNDKVNADLKTVIDDMDLYSFSPLIKRDLGYRIQSGSLNLDSKTVIKDDYLKSENGVVLVGFDMEAEDPKAAQTENAKQAESQASSDQAQEKEEAEQDKGRPISPVALKFGLDMLRDSKNNIDLDLPIEGDLNDPNFDASSAINVALRNSMVAGTKVALAMALQPFGAIAVASHYAYGQANKITFEPVIFDDGTDKMQPAMNDYLNKLSKVLKEKQGINLKVCGYYTPQDVEFWKKQGLADKALKQKVYGLAKQRQQMVKDKVIEQGVPSKRMTTCHPELEENPVSGVSISM